MVGGGSCEESFVLFVTMVLDVCLVLVCVFFPTDSVTVTYSCDPGRHLQECQGAGAGAGAGKCPKECFWSAFGDLARSALRSAPILGPKMAKKHSSERSLGTPSQVPKSTPKALFAAFSGPQPLPCPLLAFLDFLVCFFARIFLAFLVPRREKASVSKFLA